MTRRMSTNSRAGGVLLLVLASAVSLHGAVQVQQLTPSLTSPQPVGTTIMWTATATDVDPGTLDYRFSTKSGSAPNFAIVRDFHPSHSFEWTMGERDGGFLILVTARNTSTGTVHSKVAFFQISSRAVGAAPAVNPTGHPLVALYSAPPCTTGDSMRVRFKAQGASNSDMTPFKDCNGSFSMNFYIAGMLANTTYGIRHEILSGGSTTVGPVLGFTTGAIPPGLGIPASSNIVPPTGQTSFQDKFVLVDYLFAGTILFPTVYDIAGNVVWYYDKIGTAVQDSRFFSRLTDSQTLLIHVNDPTVADPIRRQNQLLREVDLAGNTLHETNVTRVAEQLVKMGYPGIESFHHDAIRLANGHTITLAATERMFPAGTQGSPTNVNILGDMVVDLDANLQVAWAWNPYGHLNVNRAAILGETCTPAAPGCPPFYLSAVANDWMHTNSVNYSPADGHLTISMRHQDWAVKIDYANGAGTGNVLWRLGVGGDFTPISADPYPFFSHQHDAGYELGGSTIYSVYDNGNTRVAQTGSGNTRGQVWRLDEAALTATLLQNADLGVYSFAVGNGHRLANGNYFYHSGLVAGKSQATEVYPGGAINFIKELAAISYRSYRLRNMYTPPVK